MFDTSTQLDAWAPIVGATDTCGVKILAVACPECHAGPRVRCRAPNGQTGRGLPVIKSHRARVVITVVAEGKHYLVRARANITGYVVKYLGVDEKSGLAIVEVVDPLGTRHSQGVKRLISFAYFRKELDEVKLS